jgi:hypothetical protein
MVETNLPLKDLQKIILGKRDEQLSSIEIRNLFSYPTTPESILYILMALNTKKLDPNTTLIQGIAKSEAKEDLAAIGLALRYGANPNLYVTVPNIGNIHILAYVYLALANKSAAILNSCVILLMIVGSDPNQTIFEPKPQTIKDEYSLVEPIKGQRVLDWLEDQGYNTIIPQIQGQNYSDVEKKFMTTLATSLDNTSLIFNNTPDLFETIMYHSDEVLDNYFKQLRDINEGIKSSIERLNLTSFEKFYDRGGSLRYYQINDLILKIGDYYNKGDILSSTQLTQMLLYSIKRGISLDIDQIKLIQTSSERLLCKVAKLYHQPYWIKITSIDTGPVDLKLKLLAYHLNLNPEQSKDVLSHQIKTIMKSDPELIKKSVILRQKTRIVSDVAYINEFASCCLPDMNPNNISLIGNLYDFPDSDIAYYRDYQGTLWCFASNNFEKIVDKKINPYTNIPFPELFVNEVKNKIDYISRYRNISDNPTPISKIIEDMLQPDKPNDLYSNLIMLNIETIPISKPLSVDQMEQILSDFNIVTDLSKLEPDHQRKTFYITLYEEKTINPEIDINKLFQTFS